MCVVGVQFVGVGVCVGVGTTPACVTTCGRGAATHGDVLNVHTGFFSARTHHDHNDRHNTTRQHHTERERETERQRKRGKTRRKRSDKTRQDKKAREDGRGETQNKRREERREKMKDKRREERGENMKKKREDERGNEREDEREERREKREVEYSVFKYLRDSNSIFRAGGIISEGVSGCTVLTLSGYFLWIFF